METWEILVTEKLVKVYNVQAADQSEAERKFQDANERLLVDQYQLNSEYPLYRER